MKLHIFGLKAIAREKLFDMPLSFWHVKEKALEGMFDYFEEHDPDYFNVLINKSIWHQITDGCYSYIDGATNTFRSMLFLDGQYAGSAIFVQAKDFWKIKVHPAHMDDEDALAAYLLASKFKRDARGSFTLIKRI